MTQVVGPEGLGREFVQKADKFALCCFNQGATVLPNGILGVMASTYGISLVLVDIVNAEPIGKWLSENIEPHSLRDHRLKVRQGLNAGSTHPWRIPADNVE